VQNATDATEKVTTLLATRSIPETVLGVGLRNERQVDFWRTWCWAYARGQRGLAGTGSVENQANEGTLHHYDMPQTHTEMGLSAMNMALDRRARVRLSSLRMTLCGPILTKKTWTE
jgi:hypothetical protein